MRTLLTAAILLTLLFVALCNVPVVLTLPTWMAPVVGVSLSVPLVAGLDAIGEVWKS